MLRPWINSQMVKLTWALCCWITHRALLIWFSGHFNRVLVTWIDNKLPCRNNMSSVIRSPSRKQSATCDASPANGISNDKDKIQMKITLKSFWMVDNTSQIARFLIDCRKTKTEVFTLTDHESHRQCREPIRPEVITCNWRKARGKRVRVCAGENLVLLLIGWQRKWRKPHLEPNS